MSESGYIIPKEIIELLIEKYAPPAKCCDFCDRTHVFNEVCPVCHEQKVRCGSRCKNITHNGYCYLCRRTSHLCTPCKMCQIKYPDAEIGVTGRIAIRHVEGKLIDKWLCRDCLELPPCDECRCIKYCSPRCKTNTHPQ